MDTISKQQMAVMVARLVEFQERFSPMAKADAQFVIQETASAIELFITAITRRKVISGLFLYLSAIKLPATTAVFDAQKYFWFKPERPVKISEFGIHFFEWYYGKTEEIKEDRLLKRSALLIPVLSSDPIIAGLGGEENAETFMADISFLLEQQPNGGNGYLDANGNANIFFVRNSAQQLKEVTIYWDGKSWLFQAYFLNSGHERKDGAIVFSY